MIKNLIELYSLLTKIQRRKLIKLQILVVLMSLSEVISVLAIGSFMAIVGDMNILQGESRLSDIYQISGFINPEEFLFWFGIIVFVILLIAAIISMFTIWRLSMYGVRVGAELGSRLFNYYMYRPWLFHSSKNSSQLSKKITQECQRITANIIRPFLNLNAKVVMAFFMIIAIIIYNPTVAIVGVVIFLSSYLLIYKIVRLKLSNNGRQISKSQTLRFKLMGEGFGGIKDVLLLGRQSFFNERFEHASEQLANSQGKNLALGQLPRYAMELVAFGSVILLVLYLIFKQESNLGTIFPVLSVYAFAGFKLLPAFQLIYISTTQIRGNLAAFEAVREELQSSLLNDDCNTHKDNETLKLKENIQFKNVSFSYPEKNEPAIENFNINIPVNSVIGLVGSTGSGKSTAIDLLLGLIVPDEGEITVDRCTLDKTNIRLWQNSLGYVPQNIFLADESIRGNIAFGIPFDEIDEKRILQAAKLAHIDEFVADLPEGINTIVGERGVQLSGGQRQRIGIARALYSDVEILILDEATNALDGITEKKVMESIHGFYGKKTIIMIAHRLGTVKECDCIYLLDKGKIIDFGRFEELSQRNLTFREMAQTG